MSVQIDASVAQRGLMGLASAIPGASQKTGKDVGDKAWKNMERRVHYITHRLQRSIGMKVNEPYFTRVGADAPYAFIETSREGHDFFFGELAWLSESPMLPTTFVDNLDKLAPR